MLLQFCWWNRMQKQNIAAKILPSWLLNCFITVCIKAAHSVVCNRGQSRRRTQYEVIVFAVGLRAGAGLRTVGSLAWRGERGKLRWADGTGAQHSRPVQAFAVLRGPTGALGRSGGFRVLLGEEDRGAPADLRGQRRRRRAQIYRDKDISPFKMVTDFTCEIMWP